MHHRIQFLALGSIALISGSSATPAPAPAAVNCNDVTTGLDPSCWAKLNMTGYLRNWGATTLGADGTASIENPDSETGPTSTSTSVSPFVTGGDIGFRRRAAGCQAGEPWSTCFLRLGLGRDGEDCTHLGPNKCPAPQLSAPPPTPQIFYGIWNIYAVNNYITSLYTALENIIQTNVSVIAQTATHGPGGIPYKFNPKKPFSTDSVLVNLLLKQTNGKALINSTSYPLETYFTKTPSTTTYDQNTSVEQLGGDITYSLSEALTFFMKDLPNFIKLVDNGAFSTTKLPTLGDLTKAFES